MYFTTPTRKRLLLLATLAAMWLTFETLRMVDFHPTIRVELLAKTTATDQWRLFYASVYDTLTDERHSVRREVAASADYALVRFEVPEGYRFDRVRLDFGPMAEEVRLSSMRLSGFLTTRVLGPGEIAAEFFEGAKPEGLSLSAEEVVLRKTAPEFRKPELQGEVGKFYEESLKYKKRAVRIALMALVGFVFYYTLKHSEFLLQRFEGRSAYDIALTLSFVLLVSLPLISTLAPIDKSGGNTEKRALAMRPELKLKTLMAYPRAYDAYFSDNFGFRNMLVKWDNELNARHLRVSNDKVVIGSGGWLYLAGQGIEDYKCANAFSEAELEGIRKSLQQRRDWLKERGIKFYFVIAPNKEGIYPEYLPGYIRKSGPKCRIDQVYEYLAEHSDIATVDVRGPILAEKPVRKVYFRTDTHWNEYGAFLAYRQVMERLAQDFPTLKVLGFKDYEVVEKETTGGDLTMMLSIAEAEKETNSSLKPRFATATRRVDSTGLYKNPNPYQEHNLDIFEIPGSRLPRMFMFRDSFSVHMAPYFAESFGRSGYVWATHLTPEIIEGEKPDLVVLEVVERYLGLLVLDAFDSSYMETLGGGPPAPVAAAKK